MELVKENSEVLRQVAVELTREERYGATKILEKMLKLLKEQKAYGLAAPQVGVGKRLAVLDDGQTTKLLINPRIVLYMGAEFEVIEGCLSLPGRAYLVKRRTHALVEYRDKNFRRKVELMSGLLGQIAQHEIDHLNGILISDHGRQLERTE